MCGASDIYKKNTSLWDHGDIYIHISGSILVLPILDPLFKMAVQKKTKPKRISQLKLALAAS